MRLIELYAFLAFFLYMSPRIPYLIFDLISCFENIFRAIVKKDKGK